MSLPPHLCVPIDILMIDNFDSFTWNLYQSLCLLGADVTVIRNDAIPRSAIPQLRIKRLIVSPGPGHPQTDSGISREAIKYFAGKVPIMGVCMGLECVVDVFGGQIAYAGEIMHGKVSGIRHDARGCFKDLPQGIQSTRYHSLSAGVKTLPDELAVTAVTEHERVIMGIRHRKYTVEAVQYHPESILSESGDDLLRHFMKLKGGTWEENPEFRVLDPSLPAFEIGSQPAASTSAKIPTILEKICAQRQKDVDQAKATPGTTPEDLKTLLSMKLSPPQISFPDRLKAAEVKPALMAEVKRASPSKGPIAMNGNAAQQALTYALAGASVISVLTEPTWFKGSLLDMRLARQAIDNLPHRPAILRKDFIIDEYQIDEARLHGADTVLLIVATLTEKRLEELYAYSQSLGMEPLVEVNNAKEMEIALKLGAKVIGVNNRNLHDFNVDMGTTSRLAEMVRERDVILCALSGIKDAQDVNTYVEQGVGAVLVGESLMRAPDTRAFIRQLLSIPESEAKGKGKETTPLSRSCGIRTEEEALAAAEAGADMLGLMFVPKSKRYVSLEKAQQIAAAIHSRRLSKPVLTSGKTLENEPWFTAQQPPSRSFVWRFAARPLLVGVFQNQPLSVYLTPCVPQLDLVQLHGSEPAELAKHYPVPVIRVFHVSADGRGLADLARPGLHQFALLDAVLPGSASALSGGTGTTVDWALARDAVRSGEVRVARSAQGDGPVLSLNSSEALYPMPVILAGGPQPENVSEAVDTVAPWAVDVSGGVELEDGSGKDLEKVRAFVKAAKKL
uniref:Multifunctional tryptophan biosynthesis protein n=1 Tax=Phanerodontia chrysosporium TaxID=2822231 RepID=TRPG_PHACH|nr:RecName: Full=Multifunctional tryptophan biosynthesis protein; Includes: RecName: Full=Anthranilate synthase component 2; Short=AS; AltName: Full=Anthranilate synthase, glutamine amidotransferase component; Includes: RecName: Full=Indole-3-glycerol phosphate synthase; Short=IGPS; Includes: RecName: Full=N-(5'-phosphoribosyl)anthranilate isomerase; Short=PRAI [Phanerodontia chrysosporium]CAA39518.1 TrpC [Phanerodontia chrysosporium]